MDEYVTDGVSTRGGGEERFLDKQKPRFSPIVYVAWHEVAGAVLS